MSKRLSDSQSPTPTPTNPSPTSRRNVEENNSPQNTQSSGLRDDPSGPHSILPQVESPNVNLPHTRPIRPIETSIPDQHMAKRIRSSNVTSESDEHSGSLQSQQDDVALTSCNTLMALGAQSNTAGETVSPKKKRTRTLTTPYQAAVLHSLLSQSRFPTTAKREEVGRLIGLSARKVQIWFQNQRQKARRPRSQSDPNTKHPQYGAFSSMPPSGPEYGVQPSFSTHLGADSQSLIQLASGSSQSLHSAGAPVSTPDSYSSLSDAPQLLGPGVPGLDVHPRGTPLGGRNSSTSLPQIGQLDVHSSSAGSSRLMHQISPPTSPTPGNLLPGPLSFPSHHQDTYGTLRPIAFGSGSRTRPSISPPGASPLPLAASQPYVDAAAPPATTDRPFIHFRPSGSIPPPFTLQPQPQWDTGSFARLPTRPDIWSPPNSSRSSVPLTQPFFVPPARPSLLPIDSVPNFHQIDAAELFAEETSRNAQPSAPQIPPPHQSRVGRYDPVRSTVVPFATPSPPVPSPPLPPPDMEHMVDRR